MPGPGVIDRTGRTCRVSASRSIPGLPRLARIDQCHLRLIRRSPCSNARDTNSGPSPQRKHRGAPRTLTFSGGVGFLLPFSAHAIPVEGRAGGSRGGPQACRTAWQRATGVRRERCWAPSYFVGPDRLVRWRQGGDALWRNVKTNSSGRPSAYRGQILITIKSRASRAHSMNS